MNKETIQEVNTEANNAEVSAMDNAQKETVTSNTSDEKDIPVKWDNLIEIYTNNKEILVKNTATLGVIGQTFKEIFEKDEELAKQFVGASKVLGELTEELINLLKSHSKEETSEKGQSLLRPFIGDVDVNNEDHMKVYTYAIMSYSGFSDKLITTIENTLLTLLGNIKTKAAELGIEVPMEIVEDGKETQEDKKEEPTKGE